MTILRSHRPGFCETVVWSLTFRVENLFEKKMKKTQSVRPWYVTGGPGQKPD